jgi:hypothetical protein
MLDSRVTSYGCTGEFDGLILEDTQAVTVRFEGILESLDSRLNFGLGELEVRGTEVEEPD